MPYGVTAAVPVNPDMPAAAAAAAYGHAAFRAELRPLRPHAGRCPPPVGNEFAAKPHGIRGAGLLDIRALGARAVEAAKDCADRQRQPANDMYDPHLVLPRLELFRSGAETSGSPKRSRWPV
jgi:hypothetical protein